MTLYDMNYFLKQIQVLYIDEAHDFTLEELGEWYMEFIRIDKKVFKKALFEWVKSQHRPPTIHRMESLCNRVLQEKRQK